METAAVTLILPSAIVPPVAPAPPPPWYTFWIAFAPRAPRDRPYQEPPPKD